MNVTIRTVASGILFALYAGSLSAQTITANSQVSILQSPPKGVFCTVGREIGVAKPGQTFKLLKPVVAVCGTFFKHEYYLIEFSGSSGERISGYVPRYGTNGTPLFRTN